MVIVNQMILLAFKCVKHVATMELIFVHRAISNNSKFLILIDVNAFMVTI